MLIIQSLHIARRIFQKLFRPCAIVRLMRICSTQIYSPPGIISPRARIRVDLLSDQYSRHAWAPVLRMCALTKGFAKPSSAPKTCTRKKLTMARKGGLSEKSRRTSQVLLIFLVEVTRRFRKCHRVTAYHVPHGNMNMVKGWGWKIVLRCFWYSRKVKIGNMKVELNIKSSLSLLQKSIFKEVCNTELNYATYRTGRAAVIRYHSTITTINDLSKFTPP